MDSFICENSGFGIKINTGKSNKITNTLLINEMALGGYGGISAKCDLQQLWTGHWSMLGQCPSRPTTCPTARSERSILGWKTYVQTHINGMAVPQADLLNAYTAKVYAKSEIVKFSNHNDLRELPRSKLAANLPAACLSCQASWDKLGPKRVLLRAPGLA